MRLSVLTLRFMKHRLIHSVPVCDVYIAHKGLLSPPEGSSNNVPSEFCICFPERDTANGFSQVFCQIASKERTSKPHLLEVKNSGSLCQAYMYEIQYSRKFLSCLLGQEPCCTKIVLTNICWDMTSTKNFGESSTRSAKFDEQEERTCSILRSSAVRARSCMIPLTSVWFRLEIFFGPPCALMTSTPKLVGVISVSDSFLLSFVYRHQNR